MFRTIFGSFIETAVGKKNTSFISVFSSPSINMWTKVQVWRRCRTPGVPLLLCQLSRLSRTLHNDSFWEIIDCTVAWLNSSVLGWSGSLQEPGGPLPQTPDCLRQEGEGGGLGGLSYWQRSWLASACFLSGTSFSLACWKCHGEELHKKNKKLRCMNCSNAVKRRAKSPGGLRKFLLRGLKGKLEPPL